MLDEIKLDELSLNILDIVLNSVKANASLVHISVDISTIDNCLTITIKDNGCGFDVDAYENSINKRVCNDHRGRGIPLFKKSAEMTGGSFKMISTPGKGTEITSSYVLDSPCRIPLGNINSTIEALFFCCINTDFVYIYTVDDESFTLSTKDIKKIMGNIPVNNPDTAAFIKDYLKENTHILNKNRIF